MEQLKIVEIEEIEDYNDLIYTLEVEDNHNYFIGEDSILTKNCLMVLDESQNADIKQLMLFITRMGQGSKVIISGDIRQYDIQKSKVALPFLTEHVLKGIKGVAHFEFTDDDIMRHPILKEITKKYEILKENNDIPKGL